MTEEMQTEEQETQDQDAKIMRIQQFASAILLKRQEAVEGRAASGVERRWREDEMAFDGLDPTTQGNSMLDYASGAASAPDSNQAKRSKVIINIIRGKCETAIGRFSEILFPVDDRNWGLKVTPMPELVDAMGDETPIQAKGPDGQPMQVQQAAEQIKADAEKRMAGMETEIDDQLNECSFNGECRKSVASSAKIGTGILKGPTIESKLRKAFREQSDGTGEVFHMEMEKNLQPESVSVDPWDVYPDPNCGGDISRAAYIWERDTVLPRELRLMSGVDGYIESQIEDVLRSEPRRTTVDYQKDRHKLVQDTASMGSAYERWQYHGDVSRDDLLSLDVDVDFSEATTFSAIVEFVNDVPVRVSLNTLDSGELPYDFFQWSKVTGSVWGIGIPRMAMWQQRVITAAWRAMMDNAGDSSGANIAISRGITPADGKWEITGKKLWYADEEVEDVRKAFAQFQIANNQQDLQAIIDLALKFIDMETELPMLFQGEKGDMPDTLGATNIMVDSNNVALRTRVKIWDDQITRPHIERYYQYNMLYAEDNKIKGDYNVDARGTSVLLAKDQMGQAIMEIMPMKQDPDFAIMIDWQKTAKQLLAARRLDVVRPDEEIKKAIEDRAKQEQPQDPAIIAAQIRSDTELKIAEMNKQRVEIELKGKAEMAQYDRKHEQEMKAVDFDIKLMEYSEKRNIGLDKIKSDLAKESAKLKLQRELSGPDGKGPQVATPPVEPEGRASEGKAYQE